MKGILLREYQTKGSVLQQLCFCINEQFHSIVFAVNYPFGLHIPGSVDSLCFRISFVRKSKSKRVSA